MFLLASWITWPWRIEMVVTDGDTHAFAPRKVAERDPPDRLSRELSYQRRQCFSQGVVRLLDSLHRRAQNAVSASNRMNTAYCLWESPRKRLGSVAIMVYADHVEHSPKVAKRLKNLARPALGHRWELVRLLVPALADTGDLGCLGVRDLAFGKPGLGIPTGPTVSACGPSLRRVAHGCAARSSPILGGRGPS
jgi:hypothetical protein